MARLYPNKARSLLGAGNYMSILSKILLPPNFPRGDSRHIIVYHDTRVTSFPVPCMWSSRHFLFFPLSIAVLFVTKYSPVYYFRFECDPTEMICRYFGNKNGSLVFYCSEGWSTMKDNEWHPAEMLRWTSGIKRHDHIRNEDMGLKPSWKIR